MAIVMVTVEGKQFKVHITRGMYDDEGDDDIDGHNGDHHHGSRLHSILRELGDVIFTVVVDVAVVVVVVVVAL